MITKSKEKEKLKRIYADLSENQQELIQPLIENAAFMAGQLDKLQRTINKKGWKEEYQNGANQKGWKKTVEGESYLQLSKNYTSIIKLLDSMLPDNKGAGEDEFLKHITRQQN